MRLKILALMIFVLGIAWPFPTVGAAVNENAAVVQPEADQGEEALIGLGTVARVEGEKLVILEYEYETDNEEEVSYTVTPTTEYDNIKSLQDLKAGDSVEIVYMDQNASKMALAVSKEENFIEDDETAPLQIRRSGNEIEGGVEVPAVPAGDKK